MFSGFGGVNSALLGYGYGGYTKKPTVPEFNKVSSSQSQATALSSNLSNFGQIEQLASKANTLSTEQLLSGMEKIMPGITNTMNQANSLTSSWLKGELSADVQNQIQRATASQAVGGGFGGSGMGRNLTARDLGLTSLDLQKQGMAASQSWTQLIANMTPNWDFTSMFTTTKDQISLDEWNTSNAWNRDWLSNKIDAMQSPTEAALSNMAISIGDTADDISSMALTKGMSSGGGSSSGTQTFSYS